MSMARRTASILTLLAGAYLIVLPFAMSLFTRTSDAQKLNDYYRSLMSDQGINQFGTNLQIVDDAAGELPAVVLPKLAHDLGMSQTQLQAYIAQNYPHVAAFITGTPKLLPLLNPATKAVLAQRANFHDADQFPVANVPVNYGPYALLVGGSLLVGVGLLLQRDRRSRSYLVVLAIGIGMVVAPIALGWFHETAAAEKVAEAARPPFSAAVGNTVVDNIYGIDAAFVEMRHAMFPSIARHLGLTTAQMDSTLHADFPATMRLLDAWDRQMHLAARDLSLSQLRFADEFHNADATPYRALPWLVIVPGLVLVVAAGIGLRRRDDSDVPVAKPTVAATGAGS
ncbi:MAG TPA: hypothetical protein VIK54_13730 [Acidimicrobiia bacterium]